MIIESIQHYSVTDVDSVAEFYTRKDGMPIRYVCTTALDSEAASAYDIFYRSTPHPEFGNYYFGIIPNPFQGGFFITNADHVTDFVFTCGFDNQGSLVYSRHRHDLVEVQGGSIDGGRAYLKVSGSPKVLTAVVKNGVMKILDSVGGKTK